LMLVPLHQLSILLSMTLRCPQSRFAFPYFDRLNSVAWVNPNGAPQFSPVVSAWLVLRALLWGISPLPSARSLRAITALVALRARSLQRITTWRAHYFADLVCGRRRQRGGFRLPDSVCLLLCRTLRSLFVGELSRARTRPHGVWSPSLSGSDTTVATKVCGVGGIGALSLLPCRRSSFARVVARTQTTRAPSR
jgi:hypothetical protein